MSRQTSLYLAIALIMTIGFWRFALVENAKHSERPNTSVENIQESVKTYTADELAGVDQESEQIVIQGNRKSIKNALPPGGDEFLAQLNHLIVEMQADIAQPNTLVSYEIENIINDAESLITKVDQQYGLNTPDVITQLLNLPIITSDPEIEALTKKIDRLEEDLIEVLQNLQ